MINAVNKAYADRIKFITASGNKQNEIIHIDQFVTTGISNANIQFLSKERDTQQSKPYSVNLLFFNGKKSGFFTRKIFHW